jgi:pimeloyl-ACP methyl ester carboxylesterase
LAVCRALVLLCVGLSFHALPRVALAAADPRSQTFDAKGIKIRFSVEGKGDPVVLIHALHSSADINWRLTGVIPELAKDHQVIAFDLPGHGRSDKPEDDAAYGLQLVEDVVLLLDHLKIEKAHVVGYSVGGMIALKLLAMHPERVLSGTIGGMGWLRDGSGLQKVWERMPTRAGQRTPAAFTRSVGKLALSAKELNQVAIPVEILVGGRDPVKRLYVDPLRQVRKDWPVVEIHDAGHIDCIVKKEFRKEIARWIRKQAKVVPPPGH